MLTLASLAASSVHGNTTSRGIVEQCLAHIADPHGEGSRTFLKVHDEQARFIADGYDQKRRSGGSLPASAGIPVSIKDLFDVAGEVTTAGSIALRDARAASQDAPVVARLRAAGFVSVGRTNMTEFAYSGLGLNPHYGTPRNPYDRASSRIPGGSSSGAAISITDGMAFAALGTDTGGSCRIPAALCGVVGFKPTAHRIPSEGCFPLSTSFDSIGSIANSVECCAIVDAVIAGEQPTPLTPHPLTGLHFAVPQTLVLDGLDSEVSRNFDRAISLLSHAGAQITDLPLVELTEMASLSAKGGLVAAEAYATHLSLIATKKEAYDPLVLSRIMRGAEQSAADYIMAVRARNALIKRANSLTSSFDALLMPTVPTIAPKISSLADEELYRTTNVLMLRNPTVANILDRCSISLPCHHEGDPPTGLMLIGAHNDDARLFVIARGIEDLLVRNRSAGLTKRIA